jgi:phosphatidylinositol phospholipase C delta
MVISAQQLMRPFILGERRAMDPYVEVEVVLADDKRDKAGAVTNGQTQELKYKTPIVRGNGFNPAFDTSYEFKLTTKYPDFVFIRFSVKLADKTYNDRAPPIATYMVKLTSLNQGYRTIPLENQHLERLMFSTLFCHIKKEEITETMVEYTEDVPRNGSKLNRISKVVRSVPSPKTSIESSRST